MNYDANFWDNYTDENKSASNEEFTKFIRDLVVSLRVTSVLEVGCNIGNDLGKFSENFEVHGLDMNEKAIKFAKKQFPSFIFKTGSVLNMPYEDSSIDFVFTHNLLNYIPKDSLEKAINELYRVSKKYILNCESYDEKETEKKDAGTIFWNRNVYKNWLNYKVKIISNVDMHEDIEPKQPKFTLVRKIN